MTIIKHINPIIDTQSQVTWHKEHSLCSKDIWVSGWIKQRPFNQETAVCVKNIWKPKSLLTYSNLCNTSKRWDATEHFKTFVLDNLWMGKNKTRLEPTCRDRPTTSLKQHMPVNESISWQPQQSCCQQYMWTNIWQCVLPAWNEKFRWYSSSYLWWSSAFLPFVLWPRCLGSSWKRLPWILVNTLIPLLVNFNQAFKYPDFTSNFKSV